MSVRIELTDDQLVKLYDVVGRLSLTSHSAGEWTGNFGELFSAFQSLVFDHVQGGISPELAQRLTDAMQAIVREGQQVVELEQLLDEGS